MNRNHGGPVNRDKPVVAHNKTKYNFEMATILSPFRNSYRYLVRPKIYLILSTFFF